ncbi:MAG: sulfotransferase [bacterium]|nr:sulfotransferase [bacterium]
MMETRVTLLEHAGSGPAPELDLIGPLLLDIICRQTSGPLRAMFGSRPVVAIDASSGDATPTLTVPLLVLPPSCTLVVEHSVAGAWEILAGITVERTGLPVREPACPDLPRPLLATSVGRSGSTLLMQLLAAHPAIAIDSEYPYETTEARKRFVAALDSYPRMCRGQWESKYRKPGWEKLLLTTVSSLIRRADEESGQWYAQKHRERTGRSEPPRYYSEKNLGPAWLVREARPDTREIFLVRDPRDMICSTLAFNEKRGDTGFGRQDVATDLEYVAHRAAMARPWVLEPWLARRDDAYLVRYEDLVQDGEAMLAGIFRYLDLDDAPGIIKGALASVAAASDDLRKHMTTDSPAASIGRWRHDLPADLLEACRREFADFCTTFGYPPD